MGKFLVVLSSVFLMGLSIQSFGQNDTTNYCNDIVDNHSPMYVEGITAMSMYGDLVLNITAIHDYEYTAPFGVTLYLANDLNPIEFPKEKIKMRKKSSGYKYSATIILSEIDKIVLSSTDIIGYKMYLIERKVKQPKLKHYIKCLKSK